MSVHKELLHEFEEFARTTPTADALMAHLAQRLHDQMARFNWIGFYLVDPVDPGVLVVGRYAGSFAPNVRIPLDTALCGAAATSGKTVVVNDVSKDPRYLSGSELVKSNMVAPIFVRNRLVAEIDIESYFVGTFTAPEQEFIEACAAVVGAYLSKKN